MNKAIEIDLQQATYRAEEMPSGLTVESIKLNDMAAAMERITNTM